MSRVCNNCNNQIAEGYDICPYCGNILENNSTEYECQLLPGRVLKGRYAIGNVVGYGGFGITYGAVDNLMGTPVAIKEYYPFGVVDRDRYTGQLRLYKEADRDEFMKGLDRFLGEAKELVKFNNCPNVVSVLDFFTENDTAYMVMEFLNGQTLDEYIKMNGGTLKEPMLTQTIFSVCEALEIVHNEGVIHRDISPDNIFICSDMTIKIIDFGAAKQFFATESKTVSVVLKHGYAPPEQYISKGKFGPWTDIYALGATLYKAVTGILPVESVARVVEDTLVPPIELNPDISQGLNNAIIKAMEVKAPDRCQSIEEFRNVLLSGIEESETSEPEKVEAESTKSENVVDKEDSSEEKKPVSEIEISQTDDKHTTNKEEKDSVNYSYKDKEKDIYLSKLELQRNEAKKKSRRDVIIFASIVGFIALLITIFFAISNNTYYTIDEARGHIDNGKSYSKFECQDSDFLDIEGVVVFDEGLKFKTHDGQKVEIINEGIYLKFRFDRRFSEAENNLLNLKVKLQKGNQLMGYGNIYIESKVYELDNVQYDFVNSNKGYCIIDIGKLETGAYKLSIESAALDRSASVTFTVK